MTLTVGTARQLSVADTSVTEGDLGTVNATFTVSLSSAAAQDVTVDFATADGSATAPSDYTARTGTLTIPAGQTSGQIAIVIQGDTLLEGNESFQVNLSNASANATIADAQAIGTIIDNEVAPPSVTINDVAVTEGDAGTTDATFTVTLASAATGAVTVNFATADGTATAPADYTAHSGTLTFAAGRAHPDDRRCRSSATPTFEGDETFVVNLSGSSATSRSPTTRAWARSQTTTCREPQPSRSTTCASPRATPAPPTRPSRSRSERRHRHRHGQLRDRQRQRHGARRLHRQSGTLTFAAGRDSPRRSRCRCDGDTAVEGDETFVVNLTGSRQRLDRRQPGRGHDHERRPGGAATASIDDVCGR